MFVMKYETEKLESYKDFIHLRQTTALTSLLLTTLD